MEKHVATKKTAHEVQAYNPAMDLLNSAPDLAQDHLRISKIKMHQTTTTGRQGMVGELFTTQDLSKIAGPGEKIIFYPLTYKLSWYHNKKSPSDQKPVPTGITDWKSASQYEWKKQHADGTIEQNFQTATFFVVLEKDLNNPVPNVHQIVISSTSFTAAALPLMNRYADLKRNQIEPWLCKFALSSEQSKKGAWYVFKADPVVGKEGQEKASPDKWDVLRKWTGTLFDMQAKGAINQTAEDLSSDVEGAEPTTPTRDQDLQF